MKKLNKFNSDDILYNLEKILRINVKHNISDFEYDKQKLCEMKSDNYIWLTLSCGTVCFELEQVLHKDLYAYNMVRNYDEKTNCVKAYLINIKSKQSKKLQGIICELDYTTLKRDLKELPELPTNIILMKDNNEFKIPFMYFNNNKNFYFKEYSNVIKYESENDKIVIENINNMFKKYVGKADYRLFEDYLKELYFNRISNDYNIKDINFIKIEEAKKAMKCDIDIYCLNKKGEAQKAIDVIDLLMSETIGIKTKDEIIFNKIKNNTLTKKDFKILYDILLKVGIKGNIADNADTKKILNKLENIIEIEDINIEYFQELER